MTDAWDRPETAAAYTAFCRRHDRYRTVSRALVDAVRWDGVRTVLDVGAGTGVTSRAVLRRLGPEGTVTAVEPAAAMREASTVRDRRLRWVDDLPDDRFDVVVCSAALWLLGPGTEPIDTLAARLAPGGQLAFAVPAGFVGLPDGGPSDRPAALDALNVAFVTPRTRAPEAAAPPPSADALDAAVSRHGLTASRSATAVRWTSAMQRDWLRLPPVGLAMRPDLTVDALPAAVDVAVAATGVRRGHRTERWALWVAT